MCDETDPPKSEQANALWRTRAENHISRRQFGAMGAAATLAACAGVDPGSAPYGSLKEDSVTITTPDGTMDAFFVRPDTKLSGGGHPAVICWPDIAGLRDAFKLMARRTAADGFAVLVINPYYRDLPAPQFTEFADFLNGGWDKVDPWRAKLDAQAIMRDALAVTAWLDDQGGVDAGRAIGTEGYCMGGPFTIWSAAALPDRLRAAASFHGAWLVGDDPDSPNNLLAASRASHLIAIAQNDDAKDPDARLRLKAAADAGGRSAEIEVYAADHGWCVLDSLAYNKEEAERAYSRKMALYAGL